MAERTVHLLSLQIVAEGLAERGGPQAETVYDAIAEIERLRRAMAAVIDADEQFGHLADEPLPPGAEPTPLRLLLDLARLVHEAALAAKGKP